MSVINEMLRNLEQRQSQAETGAGVAATRSTRSETGLGGWLRLVAITLAISIVGLLFWKQLLNQEANEPVEAVNNPSMAKTQAVAHDSVATSSPVISNGTVKANDVDSEALDSTVNGPGSANNPGLETSQRPLSLAVSEIKRPADNPGQSQAVSADEIPSTDSPAAGDRGLATSERSNTSLAVKNAPQPIGDSSSGSGNVAASATRAGAPTRQAGMPVYSEPVSQPASVPAAAATRVGTAESVSVDVVSPAGRNRLAISSDIQSPATGELSQPRDYVELEADELATTGLISSSDNQLAPQASGTGSVNGMVSNTALYNSPPTTASSVDSVGQSDSVEIARMFSIESDPGSDDSRSITVIDKANFSAYRHAGAMQSQDGMLALIAPMGYPGEMASTLRLVKDRQRFISNKAAETHGKNSAPAEKIASPAPAQPKQLHSQHMSSDKDRALVRRYMQQGDSGPAERLLAAAPAAQLKKADLKLLAAQLAVSKGQIPQAISVLESNPPAVTGHEDYYQLWAALAFQREDYVLAESIYQQLLAHQPNDSKSLMGLAFSMKFQGQSGLAISAFQRALRGVGLTVKARRLIVSELSELANQAP